MIEKGPMEAKIFDNKVICVKRDTELSFYNVARPKIVNEEGNLTAICEAG